MEGLREKSPRSDIMRIAICDDVEKDRQLLLKLIKETINTVDINDEPDISQFALGEDLEHHYSNGNSHFDIIFLDIFMPGKDGIELTREIRKYDKKCLIIFTTISTEHALDSYSVFAYNYIVKPITINKFRPVFLRANKDVELRKQKSLCIKTGAKIHTIHFRDIKYITSRGKKIF